MNREQATKNFRGELDRAVRNAAADLRRRADRLDERAATTGDLDIYALLRVSRSLEEIANNGPRLDLSPALQGLAHQLHEIAWQSEQTDTDKSYEREDSR